MKTHCKTRVSLLNRDSPLGLHGIRGFKDKLTLRNKAGTLSEYVPNCSSPPSLIGHSLSEGVVGIFFSLDSWGMDAYCWIVHLALAEGNLWQTFSFLLFTSPNLLHIFKMGFYRCRQHHSTSISLKKKSYKLLLFGPYQLVTCGNTSATAHVF